MDRIPKIGITILLLALLPVISFSQTRSPSVKDSLLFVRQTATESEKAYINLKIALYHYPQDVDSVLYYRSLLEKYQEQQYDKLIDAFIRKFYGFEAHHNLDIEKAMDHAREALLLFSELGEYQEMGWLALNLGKNYFRLGDYASATEQHMMALGYFEQSNYKEGIAEVYNELGKISYHSRYPQKAKEYFETSLKIYNDLKFNNKKYKIYNNLGILLLDQNEVEQSLKYFYKAANGFRKLDDQRKLALVCGNIAIGYDKALKPDSAMLYSRRALDLSMKAGDDFGLISGMINMGYFLRLRNEFDSSLNYLEFAMEMARKKKIATYEIAAYKECADLFADLQDFENAYMYYLKRDSLNNKIREEKSEQRIEELLFSYRQRIREKELLQLKTEQQMQQKLNYIFILLILVSFIVVIILISGYNRSKNQKKLLEEKNQLLNSYNKKLINSEKELKRMNYEKNRLFSIIAHDLRNPVSAISGFTDLLNDKFDDLDYDTKMEYIEQIRLGTRRALSLLDNMLLWARSQMDMVKIRKTETSVKKTC